MPPLSTPAPSPAGCASTSPPSVSTSATSPGYPASAGCIRLPGEIAPVFFDHTVSGSSVQVFNSWHKTAADAQLIASR